MPRIAPQGEEHDGHGQEGRHADGEGIGGQLGERGMPGLGLDDGGDPVALQPGIEIAIGTGKALRIGEDDRGGGGKAQRGEQEQADRGAARRRQERDEEIGRPDQQPRQHIDRREHVAGRL